MWKLKKKKIYTNLYNYLRKLNYLINIVDIIYINVKIQNHCEFVTKIIETLI